jgi:mono/diheme cytochrome c family protein
MWYTFVQAGEMARRRPFRVLLVFGWALFGASCVHEPLVAPGPGPGGGGGGGCDPNVVYFEQDILPILISNCAMPGCHSSTNPADGIDLTSYQSLMAADVVRPYDLDRDLYEVITETDPDKIMPRPPRHPLSQAQIDRIAQWIMQGAQNNSCAAAGCDTLNVTYTGTIAPLVQQRCQGCHSGATPQGGLDLTSWSVLNSVANDGRLAATINHATGAIPMPPSGPKLPDCNIRQFMLWIEAGAPNN